MAKLIRTIIKMPKVPKDYKNITGVSVKGNKGKWTKDKGNLKLEKLRAEVLKIIKESKGADMSMRSCWKCNSAHEHLKKAVYPIWCFACGHYYFKGVDITIYD